MPPGKARDHFVSENIELLAMGLAVIQSLQADLYADGHDQQVGGGVGQHFRHIIEFYVQFLDGLSSRVDYESRKRDEQIERNPIYAASVIEDVVARLEGLRREDSYQSSIEVVTEVLDGEGHPLQTASSIDRELSALASHTIHHYAIILLLLRGSGVVLPENFGIAPSTLRYRAARPG
jgi:hypothetical protein